MMECFAQITRNCFFGQIKLLQSFNQSDYICLVMLIKILFSTFSVVS